MRNNRRQTPLLLAAGQGNTHVIELLINKGAEVSAADEDGDTSLHLALVRQEVYAERDDSPLIQQVGHNLANSQYPPPPPIQEVGHNSPNSQYPPSPPPPPPPPHTRGGSHLTQLPIPPPYNRWVTTHLTLNSWWVIDYPTPTTGRSQLPHSQVPTHPPYNRRVTACPTPNPSDKTGRSILSSHFVKVLHITMSSPGNKQFLECPYIFHSTIIPCMKVLHITMSSPGNKPLLECPYIFHSTIIPCIYIYREHTEKSCFSQQFSILVVQMPQDQCVCFHT